jgi:epoxyqueuosine reductase QueG
VDVLHPDGDSPVRFEIMRELMKRGKGGPPRRMLRYVFPILAGVRRSLKSVKDNPAKPKIEADSGLIDEIEALVLRLGASSVGYTRVPRHWIFQEKAIAFENAIVFAMEMDKPRIDSAPSIECMATVMETYRDQGRIANKLATYLRKRGYGAHAGHPLMGMALYPPMAQKAGLGWMGLNGIVITPEHGPRVRLAAVFASIENLPFSEVNDHGWIAEYCDSCRVCIKKCPPKAIYGTPKERGNGQITYVKNDRCFPFFADYYGCSVCVKVCPFNHVPYDKLKKDGTYRKGFMVEAF